MRRLMCLAPTAAVANPSAGLVVYSQQLKAPAYYNGTRWNKLSGTNGTTAGATPAATLQTPSSISYTIEAGNSTTITSGTFTSIATLNNGISQTVIIGSQSTGGGTGKPSFADVTIQKAIDENSISFISVLAPGKPVKSITFDVYYAPAGVPVLYYSIKLTNAYLSNYQVGFSDQAIEQISFAAEIYGYEAHVLDPKSGKTSIKNFAWDRARNTSVPY
jgi:type VI protein secretion system component Hcp